MNRYEKCPEKAMCPVCCAEDAHLLWAVNSQRAAQHFVLKEKDPVRFADLVAHIESLWQQKTCKVLECDGCGFCYSYPYVAGDERFYSLAYSRSGYPTWKWEFQITFEVLRRRLPATAKLIEIGAGDGAFVKKIAEQILPKENIFCTEFSAYGRNQIQQLGIDCVAADVRTLSDSAFYHAADAICMFQVLEHMDQLDALFETLYRLLKPGGSVFIAVPNQNRIAFNELNGALLDMPPNHIGRWNKDCFQVIGKKYQFQMADYRVENEGFLAIAKEFIIYRFLRNTQKAGSLANHLRKVENRHLRRIAQVIGVAIHAILAIPTLVSLFQRKSNLGNSQWVHFVRDSAMGG